jgi:hypothetical protein
VKRKKPKQQNSQLSSKVSEDSPGKELGNKSKSAAPKACRGSEHNATKLTAGTTSSAPAANIQSTLLKPKVPIAKVPISKPVVSGGKAVHIRQVNNLPAWMTTSAPEGHSMTGNTISFPLISVVCPSKTSSPSSSMHQPVDIRPAPPPPPPHPPTLQVQDGRTKSLSFTNPLKTGGSGRDSQLRSSSAPAQRAHMTATVLSSFASPSSSSSKKRRYEVWSSAQENHTSSTRVSEAEYADCPLIQTTDKIEVTGFTGKR